MIQPKTPSTAARYSAHVGVDAHRVLSEPHTSGGVYMFTFLRGCLGLPPERRPLLHLYLPWKPDPSSFLWYLEERGGVFLRYPKRPLHPSRSYKEQLLWNQIVLPILARRDSLDVFFSPFHLTPTLLRKVPIVTAVHDLCFLSHPHLFSRPARLVLRIELWTALRCAKRFVTVSDFTLREWRRFFPQRARQAQRIYTGLGDSVQPNEENEMPTPGTYFLWVGRNERRKNAELVFEAFRLFRSSDPHSSEMLVAMVPSHDVSYFENLAVQKGIRSQCPALSNVSEKTKWVLFRQAKALLFPSSCEGFGLPVLEAMCVGTIPIICPEGPGQELVPEEIPRVEPLTASSLCDLMKWASTLGDEKRTRLATSLKTAAAAFRAENMARELLQLLEEVAKNAR